MPRPGRRRSPEKLARADRPVVGRGRAATACCRSTTARSSCSPRRPGRARPTPRRPTSTGRPSPTSPRTWRPASEVARTRSRPTSSGRRPTRAGCIVAMGSHAAGYSFFLKDGRLGFDYNDFGNHTVLLGDRDVPVGRDDRGVRLHPRGRGSGDLHPAGRRRGGGLGAASRAGCASSAPWASTWVGTGSRRSASSTTAPSRSPGPCTRSATTSTPGRPSAAEAATDESGPASARSSTRAGS